jgi:hypothetical protein
MFKIIKEITVWTAEYKVYNHTYLLDPKNRIIAYLNAKDGTIHQLKSPYEIDKRYRKFVEIKNAKLSKLIPKNYKEEKDERITPSENVRVFNVKSKNKVYTVTFNTISKIVVCGCIGYGYRMKCRHSDAIKSKLGV